ncbi:toll/interleukin-1 receptor domain-containing protein [Bradyrhizobium sp. 195]|uniref:toll/interleukin-1 receptor domain-containing protein n=1 Tax=Bradyrhizobium sp. 195 TaxID=2782662 RepID=UPI002000C28E|nr:toll/interleukin-1 receptor domain-containing protein [Bradyrhizobium sp. 195]UPK28427.1 toll/interleukin-1 receptor domain-containing protein [Bradyrhizobium sp. 195]
MADVFISYSKAERKLTEDLAKILVGAGLSVWWDTELLPIQRFRAEIDAQLNNCSAAVIIWSATSANSDWVLSEADHAIRQGKLVNAHHSDILPEHLPKPFGQIHAVPLTDTDRILRAIKLITTGKPSKATAVSAGETRASEFITDAVQDALKYAPHLRDLADRAGWEDDETYPNDLLKLAEKVMTPLRLFRERLPYTDITSYRGRRLVEHLDEATTYAHRQISKEIGWLRSHGNSESVVMGARGDLSVAAERLLEKVELPPR